MTTRELISEINEVFTIPDNLKAGASEIKVHQGFFVGGNKLDIKSYVLVVGISPHVENGRRRIVLYIDGCLYSMLLCEFTAEELAQIASQFARRNCPLACVRLHMSVNYENTVTFEVPEYGSKYATDKALREVLWLINNGDVEFALNRMTYIEDEDENKEKKRERIELVQHDNVITENAEGESVIELPDGSVISDVNPDRDECEFIYPLGNGVDFIAPGETVTMTDGYVATLSPEIQQNSSGEYGLLTEHVPERNGYPAYENTIMHYFRTGFQQQYIRPTKFITDPSEMNELSKKILEDAVGKIEGITN